MTIYNEHCMEALHELERRIGWSTMSKSDKEAAYLEVDVMKERERCPLLFGEYPDFIPVEVW